MYETPEQCRYETPEIKVIFLKNHLTNKLYREGYIYIVSATFFEILKANKIAIEA